MRYIPQTGLLAARPASMLCKWPVAIACNITLPKAEASTGPADHMPVASVGHRLAEKCIERAAANHANRLQMATGYHFKRFQHQSVGQAQALKRAARGFAGRLWRPLAGSEAVFMDELRHVPWLLELLCVGIEMGAAGLGLRGRGDNLFPP